MKRFVTLISISAMLLMALSCKKDKGEEEEEIIYPEVAISVTGIEDNRATITATLLEGEFYGGKVLVNLPISEATFNYSRELALMSYVNEHGTAIDRLPWTTTIEGIKADVDFLSAVIVYDKKGIPMASAYETWTSVGVPESWSSDNNAGDLEDNTL